MEGELNATAYPKELQDAEFDLIATRRGLARSNAVDQQLKKSLVGFGLSGGGIRSATFCLGIFQALAALKLLGEVDYTSAVSGGGYFTSFLGRLFARPDIAGYEEVEEILTPEAANADDSKIAAGTDEDDKWRFRVFRWLRTNGRYLAPKGSGDILLGFAVVLRNWFAIQIVLITSFLALFVALQMLRVEIEACGFLAFIAARLSNDSSWIPLARLLWWSPYALLAIAFFLFLVVPPAWAYWLVEIGSGNLASPWLGWGLVLVLDLLMLWQWQGTAKGNLALLALITTLLALCFYGWVRFKSKRKAKTTLVASDQASDTVGRLLINSSMRVVLTQALRWGLIWTGAAAALVLIDSVGQSLYAKIMAGELNATATFSTAVAALGSLTAVGRWIIGNLGFESKGKRASISMSTVAGIAATLMVLTLLVSIDAFSHAIRWHFEPPSGVPARFTTEQQISSPSHAAPWFYPTRSLPPSKTRGPERVGRPSTSYLQDHQAGLILLVLGALAWLFGNTWTFLNRSSQQALYSSRLTRAYLGASNLTRLKTDYRPISEVIAGDDISQREYWRGPLEFAPMQKQGPGGKPTQMASSRFSLYRKKAPLHLLNVTVNETFDPTTGVQQRDRKGQGMALGPCGISLGVQHHVVYDSSLRELEQIEKRCEHAKVFPPRGTARRAFEYVAEPNDPAFSRFVGEQLTLGDWTSISGAAFSTGNGYRTSLGISILAGLFNLRLGYWWDSGTDDQSVRKLRKILTRSFPVQTFLLKELMASFNGPEGRYWYLSDGGDFENLGAYELIRRRVKLIVVVDGGADGDYTFEDLGNLVRKARLDFGAEIRFMDESELPRWLPTKLVQQQFGSLDQLRRGSWKKEPVEDPVLVPGTRPRKRLSIDPVDDVKESLRHAAFAGIRYDGKKPTENPDSFLIYIKPTLIGDESADVRRYHAEHPSFPHESTFEQFFGEDQWESYRKLGEHIGLKIFGDSQGGLCASFAQTRPVPEPDPSGGESANSGC